MRRFLPAVSGLLIGLVCPAAWGAEAQPRGVVFKYLAERASRMAAQLPPIPKDLPAWEKRRDVVRSQLAAGLGLPEREPMRAKVLATRREKDVVVEDVIYLWAERAYVAANVVRPGDAPGPLPALVMPPGWLGQLKDEVYKTFVDHMARKGYLTLYIDDPHVGKRVAPYAGLYGAAAAAGTQVMGIQVFDTLRGLDYLLTRADVDPRRIGVAGLCQGSEQAWLAAALEERFQIAVPVCGTTTYEGWARMPFDVPHDLSDPSPYVAGVLRYTDWHEINAAIAPRAVFIASNSGDIWWPVAGYDKVVSTLDGAFQTYGKPDRFRHLRDLRSHSMTPFIPELAPWIDAQLKALPASAAVSPRAAGEPLDPDPSMLRWCQRRIARQTEALPRSFATRREWEAYRGRFVAWLHRACDLEGLRAGAAKDLSRNVADGLVHQVVELPLDAELSVPVVLVRRESPDPGKRPAIVLSHESGQCGADPAVLGIAQTLARDGYLVCVPEHASPNPNSRRHVASLVSFYGAADTVGVPPMALRVWDDLRAARYLLGRPDVDAEKIVVVGLGVGGVDAAITAALEPRIAGCCLVGAVTVRDWAHEVAPKLDAFDRILPYLPDLTTQTDLEYVTAAVAPRPLLLVDATDRPSWPAPAYQRVRKMAEHVFALESAPKGLTAVPARSSWGVEEVRAWLTGRFPPRQP